MLATLLVAALSGNTARAEPVAAKTPIAPTLVSLPKQEWTLETIARKLTEQTKFPIAVSADAAKKLTIGFDKVPFWEALEAVAAAGDARVGMHGPGIALVPRGSESSRASIDGPFRISPREVRARLVLGSGRADYEVVLDVRWEPRFEVFRMSAVPTISRATDDIGTKLTHTPTSVFSVVADNAAESVVRLGGLTRKSTAIAELEGQFTVTASPAMLPFIFANLDGNKPVSIEQHGVKVTLQPPMKDGKLWTLPLTLSYPPDGPVFESYEEGIRLRANTLKLIGPDGKAHAIEKLDLNGLSATYRFEEGNEVPKLANGLKGWKLEYRTPAPLREYPIHFRLKDIPLP